MLEKKQSIWQGGEAYENPTYYVLTVPVSAYVTTNGGEARQLALLIAHT